MRHRSQLSLLPLLATLLAPLLVPCNSQSWLKHTAAREGGSNRLCDLSFASTSDGWAVGYHNSVLHTADGGLTWRPQHPELNPDKVDWHGVSFVTSRHGWIVGSHGQVHHTSDAGVTWRALSHLDHNQTLRAVHAWPAESSDTSVYAVGDEGLILRWSSREAASRASRFTGTRETLNAVVFASPSHGWVVGEEGAIYVTSDAGDTWRPQYSGTTSGLTGVLFANTTVGCAVGRAGALVCTRNGGATWNQVEGCPSASSFVGIAADASGRFLWAVDSRGGWCSSEDVGVRWGGAEPARLPESGYAVVGLARRADEVLWIATEERGLLSMSTLDAKGATSAFASGAGSPAGESGDFLRSTPANSAFLVTEPASSSRRYVLGFAGAAQRIELPNVVGIRSVSFSLFKGTQPADPFVPCLLDVAGAGNLADAAFCSDRAVGSLWKDLYVDGVRKAVRWDSIPAGVWVHVDLVAKQHFQGALALMNLHGSAASIPGERPALRGHIGEVYLWSTDIGYRGSSATQDAPIESELLAHFQLDEGEGKVAHDRTGAVPSARLIGGPAWEAFEAPAVDRRFLQEGTGFIPGVTISAYLYHKWLKRTEQITRYYASAKHTTMLVDSKGFGPATAPADSNVKDKDGLLSIGLVTPPGPPSPGQLGNWEFQKNSKALHSASGAIPDIGH
ncbi:hypothetical protein CYMTET_8546 [Cymbomonas tetramitiformis]|uniref:Photosynthesis system II assembly factor Ycf48/Hcf136-like domain-containing protein n=1 Tax=Cymbomonas tetramitiformis TaxID=36881 RepID=A0AAE0GTE7_9CHLO|nr:hypothetical protein CYMTET_8546 [Cymbomonas tetramitiformis]